MPALQVHDADNVATVFEDRIEPGTVVEVHDKKGAARQVVAGGTIPYGHKLAIKDIPAREPIVKYGEIIGVASQAIAVGDHVHVHNLDSQRGRGDLTDGI